MPTASHECWVVSFALDKVPVEYTEFVHEFLVPFITKWNRFHKHKSIM